MDLTVWIFRNAVDRRFRIVFLAEPLDRIMHCLDRIGVRNIDNVGRHRAGRDIDALSIRVGRLQVKGDALLQIADIDIWLVNQPVIIVVEPPDRFTRRSIYAQTGRNGLEQDVASFRVQPLGRRHAADQFVDQRPVRRRNNVEQGLSDNFFRRRAGQGHGGAGGIANFQIGLGFKQHIGGAKRQGDETVAITAKIVDIIAVQINRARNAVHFGASRGLVGGHGRRRSVRPA
ncbi:MAG: hypothetical protein VX741_13680 [Pseudomonadota bacterium]|nr:hypothetical protein [Pseudomonadota bacterium]